MEIRCPQPRNWVPSLSRVPARAWHDSTTRNRLTRLRVNAVAADGLAARNVVQGGVGLGVKQRVEEAELLLAGAETGVVQQTNNGGPDGGGGGGAAGAGEGVINDDGVTGE